MKDPNYPDYHDLIEELVKQTCTVENEDGKMILDSMALSAYAWGLRWLADCGRVKITHETGRRVIAEWVEVEK